jgi:hypothetical protein
MGMIFVFPVTMYSALWQPNMIGRIALILCLFAELLKLKFYTPWRGYQSLKKRAAGFKSFAFFFSDSGFSWSRTKEILMQNLI